MPRIDNKMRFINTLVLVWATTFSTLAAGQSQSPRTISVSGQGTVTAAPDMATISTGVTTKAATAALALDGNSAAVDEIFLVLESDPYNVAEADFQTTYFNVYPEYNYTYDSNYNAIPEVIAYSVSNSVSVKVRNLDILGNLLDALITAGATQVDGVSFGCNNSTALTTQARRLAWHDARSRAQFHASAAEVTLGSILSVEESGANMYYTPEFGLKETAMDSAAVPIATGQAEVTAYINVVYEIVS